jgi:polyamine oxidase
VNEETVSPFRRSTPLAVFRSSWVTDPDFEMTYSYLRSGASPGDRERIAEPWLGLQIAGEATWSKHPGTMHGAWFSGERAAARVLSGADGAGSRGLVVVVGAGLAGIAAARSLRGAGRDVLILEAGERSLGRARGLATPYGDVLPGGMWLHGVDGHPLVPFVRAAGIDLRGGLWEVRDDDPANIASPTFTADGLLGRIVHAREIARFRAIEGELDELSDGDAPFGDRLGQLLGGLGPVSALVQETWFRTLYEGLVAGDLRDLSRLHRHEEFLLPGDDMMLLAPLSQAERYLLDGLDVRRNHRVVSLTRNDGAWDVVTEHDIVSGAASVILTAALPVIERLRVTPGIPAATRTAMSRIGRGREGKFFAVFEEAFWLPLSSFFMASSGSPIGRVFVDVSEILGRPTLLGFSTFHETERLETGDEASLREEVAHLLEPVARWSYARAFSSTSAVSVR